MATLQARDSGEEVVLPARCLIGRARPCDLVIAAKLVSSQHAALEWIGADWELCDLGSRNGTYVDGRRLAAGERCVVRRGAELCFGADSLAYVLRDAGPPELMARELATGELRLAEGGYLVLPSAQHPECGVYQDPQGRWISEAQGEPAEIDDRAVIATSGGAMWCVYLPTSVAATLKGDDVPMQLAQLRLRFAFTRDEEHIELVAHGQGRTLDLQARAHHYPLLLLARQRLADIRAGVAEPEQGWVRQEELLRMLRMQESHLNISIHRARTQLGKLGVLDAAALVERRSTTKQLRVGIGQLELVPLDGAPPTGAA